MILAAILIILYKTVFLTLKTENILFMSVIGVALYHFLNWLLTEGEFGFYFFNSEILMELIFTALLLSIVFKMATKLSLQRNQETLYLKT